jgi:hypothetical protein
MSDLEITQRLQAIAQWQIACDARRLHDKYRQPDFRDGQRSEYDRQFQDLRAGSDE